MFTTIFEQIKIYAKLIIAILIFLSLSASVYLYRENRILTHENDRVTTNFDNSKFKIDSVIAKNGELNYSVEALTLKVGEAESFSGELMQKVKDMDIKLKNLESVTQIEYRYIYKVDSSKITKLNDTTFISTYSDKYLSLNQKVTMTNKKSSIDVSDIKIIVSDTLTMPYEINYKGWWFWRKAVDVTVYVKSENPNFRLSSIKCIKLTK